MNLFDDLNTIALIPTTTENFKNKNSRVLYKNFIKGPVNLDWVIRAGQLPGKALHVAIHILYLKGMNKSETFSFNLSAMSRLWKIDRSSVSRGLKCMEKEGLIKVERNHGRKSTVIIIDSN